MPRIQSENGVVCELSDSDTVVLAIPRDLLTDLQAAWQDIDDPDGSKVVGAVRDLFDGQDGALWFLTAIGIPTDPR